MHPPRYSLKHSMLALSIALSFGISPARAATGDLDSSLSASPPATVGNGNYAPWRAGSQALARNASEDVDDNDDDTVEDEIEEDGEAAEHGGAKGAADATRDANDQRLTIEALRERWAKDPAMHWFINASEADQSAWLGHLQTLGQRYRELAQVQKHSKEAVRQRLRTALSAGGVGGAPDDYVVSLTHAIQVGDVRVPVDYKRSLTDACLHADPGMDVSTAVLQRDGEPVAEADRQSVLALLTQSPCRVAAADRLGDFDSQRPLLEAAFAALLETQFKKDVIEAQAQGYLTGGHDAWLKGLDIVNAAVNGATDVDMGTLTFSTGSSGVSVALPQWLVFVKRDAQGKEDGVVLYRPEEQELAMFNSQQHLYQYLDIRRLSMDVASEIPGVCPARPPFAAGAGARGPKRPRSLRNILLDAAGPGESTPVMKFFDDLCAKPSLWNGNIQFHAYDSHDFLTNLSTWTKARVDLMAKDMRRLAQAPGLPSLIARYQAVADEYAAFNETHVPTLREFTRRSESEKLTTFFRAQQLVAADEKVDADTILIEFNGRKRPWTDWVLSEYRQHGDNVFAASNNFAQDATLIARDAALTARLNASDIKAAIERNLRSTYAGDSYIEAMRALLQPSDPRYAKARNLRVAMQILEMQLALDIEYSRGNIDLADYPWLKGVLDGLPVSSGMADVELAQFMISGTRIPGMWVISRKSATGKDDSFVFVPRGPYGRTLYKNDAYFQDLIRTNVFKDYFIAKALSEDQPNLDKAMRAVNTPGYFYTSFAPIDDFKAECDQVLKDAASNAAAATTSKAEVIWEQVLKGARYGTAAVCTASTAGAGAALCAVGTASLMGVDIHGAVDKLLRGREDEALMDVAFLWLDTTDVGMGVSAGLKAFNPKALLKLARKTHFSSVDEAKDAIDAAARYGRHFREDGSLNPGLSKLDVTIGQLTHMPTRPGKSISGKFYEYRGRVYITEGGRIFEVFSDNGWATVRVRDPAHPHGPGVPVVYRHGRWQHDEAGLLGGGKAVSKLTDQGYAPLESAHLPSPELAFAMPASDQGFMKTVRWTDSDYHIPLSPDSQRAREAFMARRREFLDAAKVNAFTESQAPQDVLTSSHFVPRPPRPLMPASLDDMTPTEAVAELYKATDGLVIGEGQGSIGGRVFLVDNMAMLQKQGVKTIYIENLLHDVDQIQLDAFFATPKRQPMPASLKARLDRLEPQHFREQHTRYTFSDLVKAAKKRGVRVVSADQVVSTVLHGVWPTNVRDMAMPYQAQRIIDAYQAQSPGKWIALVDDKHANTYRDSAGIAERTGAIGIRIADTPAGNPMTMGYDPGRVVASPFRHRDGDMIRSDFLLEMPVVGDNVPRVLHVLNLPDMPQAGIPEGARGLTRAGDFVLLQEGEPVAHVLYHRSTAGTVLKTEVHHDEAGFHIDRLDWSTSGQNYQDIDDLSFALVDQGMANRTPLTRIERPRQAVRDIPEKGDFVIAQTEGSVHPVLFHRNRDGNILETPIRQDADGFKIDRPEWPLIHETAYTTVDDLVRDLEVVKGMKNVTPVVQGGASGL